MPDRVTKLLIFILIGVSSLFGQKSYFFESISVPAGLSNPDVYAICQDKFGYMWFGTQDGLNKYDGYTFEIYRNEVDNDKSLSDNFVFSAFEDSNGDLWFGTGRGLNRFNRTEETFERYFPLSIESAPPTQLILTIFEDSHNRFWIGSSRGIFLFDRAKREMSKPKILIESVETSANGITAAILETRSGKIITSDNKIGLMEFDEENKFFSRIDLVNDGQKYFSDNKWVLKFYEDQDGIIWISGQDGFFRYDPQMGIVRKIQLFKDIKLKSNTPIVTRILEADQINIWITSSEGLFLFNRKTEQITAYRTLNDKSNGIESNLFFNAFRDISGVLWFASTGGGIHKMDPGKEPFKYYQPVQSDAAEQVSQRITAIAESESDKDQFWIGTQQNGIYRFNARDGQFDNIRRKAGQKNTLKSDRISCIIEAEDGKLWIGTIDSGLVSYDPAKGRYTSISAEPDNDKGLSSNNIFDLTNGSMDNLWIGTARGLNRFDFKTGEIERIPTTYLRKYNREIHNRINRIRSTRSAAGQINQAGDYQDIKSVLKISQPGTYIVLSYGEGLLEWGMVDYGWLENANGDTLWSMSDYFSTYGAGGANKNRIKIGLIDLEPGEYSLRYISDDSHAYGSFNDIAPGDSMYWGIQVYPLRSEDIESIQVNLPVLRDQDFADYLSVRKIVMSGDGNLWLGTNTGLVNYDPVNLRSTQVIFDRNNPTSVINNVRDLHEDSNGIVWLATDGGLIRFDPVSRQSLVFSQQNGLPSSFLKGVIEDDSGYLWVSSVGGLFRIEKTDKSGALSLLKYDVKDGLQGYEFSDAAALKTKNGELFFGGEYGFNSFYPGQINHQPPKIVIRDFFISNRRITPTSENSPLEHDILQTKHIVLTHDQNDISFEFAPIHFTRPDRNHTAYMLEGLNEDWIYDDRRFASFTNLDAGDYEFKVRGANSDGVWNENPASIKITVLPPWWATVWAYIFYGFAFVGIIFGFDRLQRFRILQRTRMREAELRAQAAEADARAIKAENDRKTHELEEARKLQLSMLPKELPKLPNLEIAVYMKTATEVGGDYYDFHVGIDGTLTVVVGDATGHGLRAGTMVTAAKSLFSSHAANPDILYTFSEITRCIKQMDMHLLAMCLSILKIKNNEIALSSAGMPPTLIYRNEKSKVDEIEIKGMPLGTFQEFPYQLENTTLNPGDTMLIYSDGLPELFNSRKEMFGYERVVDVFGQVAHESADRIIEELKTAGSDWVDDSPPDDDVTFVVIKAKS